MLVIFKSWQNECEKISNKLLRKIEQANTSKEPRKLYKVMRVLQNAKGPHKQRRNFVRKD